MATLCHARRWVDVILHTCFHKADLNQWSVEKVINVGSSLAAAIDDQMTRRRKNTNTSQLAQTPTRAARPGTHTPLTVAQVGDIAQAAFDILSTIGLSDCPDWAQSIMQNHGCLVQNDRILIPQDLAEKTISQLPRHWDLCGQVQPYDLPLQADRSFVGTGGAAPLIWDTDLTAYRASTLHDLYCAGRLTQSLDSIQFFARSLVAGDMPTPFDLDINTLFASVISTQKHVMTSVSDADHMPAIADICYQIAGSEAAFRARPFVSLNINHMVPPLRLAGDALAVMVAGIRAGFPVHANVFGQLGASSPVTLAGSVAQTLAETLAGLVFARAIDPDAQVVAGPRPMVTDLRSGGFSGGSGEQAMATAMCAQMLRHWDIPNSCIAGATDSKMIDAQSGFEKALTVSAGLQAGANLVTQAAGTQAGLMAGSFAAYVIDNDMLGSILRANVPPVVTSDTLAIASIAQVVEGDGHFLGEAETYARMKSDFLYPDIADRTSVEQWQTAGQPCIIDAANARVAQILSQDPSCHVDGNVARHLIEKHRLAFDAGTLQPLQS